MIIKNFMPAGTTREGEDAITTTCEEQDARTTTLCKQYS